MGAMVVWSRLANLMDPETNFKSKVPLQAKTTWEYFP